ncbi:ATP-binding protein, partial [Mycobacterium intracellulare]|uniref:ATP-binding protein n=1 Tax=Mycobacterium intracellulare TaxID=1767 RepID=UPI000A7024EE
AHTGGATSSRPSGAKSGCHSHAGAYERRSLAIGSHWPFEQWGHFLPEQTTAVSILDRLLHHATVVITDGDSYRMKDAKHRKEQPKPT